MKTITIYLPTLPVEAVSIIRKKTQIVYNIGGVCSLDFQGETHTGSSTKANIFADHFSSVFKNEDISYIPSVEDDPLSCIDAN